MKAAPFEKPLTYNELITKTFWMVRQGDLGPHETFQLSVSSSENPIQTVLRHSASGRVKIAHVDRINGLITWDNDFIHFN